MVYMSKKYRRVQTPKVALFLGAGASRAFDYPTTLEFVGNLTDVLGADEKRILNSILRSPEVSDIEHVLQTLDPIIDFNSNSYVQNLFKKSQVRINLVDGQVSWNDFVRWCKRLKETIISELHRQYEFDRSKLQQIIDTFNELDSILSEINRVGELHIFTTNYDSVIERFCIDSGREIEFTCGFRTDFRSGRQFWYPEELKDWKFDEDRNEGIRLYKLHGSLDWRETEDNRIERMPTEEEVSKTTRRYKRNILIYPAQKSYAIGEPFKPLMNYFEVVLNEHDLCLVIGFSFRDPLANSTFLDFLRASRKRRLIVVSPNASKGVDENLIGEEKRLRKQITCLDKLFGEEETFEVIREALTPKPKKTEEEEEF